MRVEANRASYEAMYRLLSAWLHGQPLELPGLNFEALARAAEKHLLSAAVCMALERTGLASRCPAEALGRLRNAKMASVRKALLMNAERARLLAFLEEEGVWYMPLKGILLNDLYPELGAREFSDNDILFDAARWRTVLDYMKRRGYSAEIVGEGAHDTYTKPPVYRFEMHRVLFADDRQGGFLSACAAYYADVKRRLVKDSGNRCGYHFRDEDFCVHILANAYKDYSNGGTGVRALLDVYLFRRRKGALDEAHIAEALDALGIREFGARCESIGRKLFDWPPRPEALTGEEREMLDWIESSGVYGTMEHTLRNELGALQAGSGAGLLRSKCKYLWNRIFPSAQWVRANVPSVRKHPWTLPLFWARRIYRGVFVKSGKNFRALRAVVAYSADAHREEDE